MALNQIQLPSAPQKPAKRDSFEKVALALQLAESAFGIATGANKFLQDRSLAGQRQELFDAQLTKAKSEAKIAKDQSEGRVSQSSLLAKGLTPTRQNDPGAVRIDLVGGGEGYFKQADSQLDKLSAQVKQVQLEKAVLDLDKAHESALQAKYGDKLKGSELESATAFASLNDALGDLENIGAKLHDTNAVFSPGEKIMLATQYSAGRKIVGMQLTRMFEKGRISDQDRAFYLSTIPNPLEANFTPEISRSRFDAIRNFTSKKFETERGLLESAGRDTRPLQQVQSLGDRLRVQNDQKKGGGLLGVKEASAAEKPKHVVDGMSDDQVNKIFQMMTGK